jgi:hypothetical protein
MIWIFAAVVLILAVYNKPFRKFLIACAVLVAMTFGAMIIMGRHDAQVATQPAAPIERGAVPVVTGDPDADAFLASGKKVESADPFGAALDARAHNRPLPR